ncbi:MAG TPA: hypothetical protein VFQ85_05300 [Mycobacteriales bacterium]|jgi:hypothetical protein|nr:hypothetical protein [Mycobacteriales bacterium]
MTESDFRTDDARDEAERAAAADEAVTGGDAGDIDREAMERAEGLTVDPEVAENYREATERGANVQGEGAVP